MYQSLHMVSPSPHPPSSPKIQNAIVFLGFIELKIIGHGHLMYDDFFSSHLLCHFVDLLSLQTVVCLNIHNPPRTPLLIYGLGKGIKALKAVGKAC